MNVLVVSEDAATREHLRKVLAGCREVAGMAEASSFGDGLEGAAADVVLADVSGTREDVLDTLGSLSGVLPQACILALGAYRDSRFVVRALVAGANGYLLRDRSSEDLGEALRAVSCGRVYVSPGIAGSTRSAAKPGGGRPRP